MKLDIYSHLSDDYLQKFPRVTFDKGEIIVPAEAVEVISIYYILEGEVIVYSHAFNGRRFLIDELAPGDFIGKFSQMRNYNFYCEAVADKKCRMFDLTRYLPELFRDPQFKLYFYKKTTDRLYRMYKIAMSRDLFKYDELLAYYLISTSDENNDVLLNDEYLCLKLNISSRNYFYILKKMIGNGLIAKKGKKITILDMESLKEASSLVSAFMGEKL